VGINFRSTDHPIVSWFSSSSDIEGSRTLVVIEVSNGSWERDLCIGSFERFGLK
jgi:hypothetical protein